MIYLASFILFFLAFRTFLALVNLLSRLHLPAVKKGPWPKVSVLIPARNEETVIGQLLESLQAQDYPEFEVVVCDDHSTDHTAEITAKFANEDERFSWFSGEPLPEGWLGKNFACHQLAQKASGEYLLFLDADVLLASDAISKAVSFIHEKQLALLSVFPQQKMESLAEKLTVPLMNWILQSLLPMILVRKSPFASLSAANGQFMLFDAKIYSQYQWHSRVRNQNVEDIRIARMVKGENLNMAVLLGNNDIFCHMYRDYSDAVNGFSRNVHEYFGGNRLIMTVYLLTILSGPFIVLTALDYHYLIVFITLVVFNRLLESKANGQNCWTTVLLHPLQMCSFTAIVFVNIFRRLKKETIWKGRKINLSACLF